MMTSPLSLVRDAANQQEIDSDANSKFLLLANRLKRALWNAQEIELARENLTVPQWLILSGLASNKGATLTQFSRTLGYNAGSLSRVVQQLKVRDLIVVGSDPDRRRAPLALSEAGLALCDAIESRSGQLQSLLATMLGNQRMALLAELMERAIAMLEAESPAFAEDLQP
ncbi:MarR family winged helix-turn-helix transcriptional regulator [Cupriavidus sp. CuC1]|uniref:MarR family winged helix-turn-helix transcriptional regulator n=1 Tax=Cupriavidus sp. CuC1 TaxID=3373131 RepID=UPI0037D4FBEE